MSVPAVLIPQPPHAVIAGGDYFGQLDEYAKRFGMKGYVKAWSRSKEEMVYLPVMRLDFRLVPHRPGKDCEVENIPGLLPYRDLVCCFLPHQMLTDGLQSNTPVGLWTSNPDPELEVLDFLCEVE